MFQLLMYSGFCDAGNNSAYDPLPIFRVFFLIVDLCGDDRIKANVSMWKSSQRGILD